LKNEILFYFQKMTKELSTVGPVDQYKLTLNGDCPRWVVTFLQKCSWKVAT
jgi:hypothetical protein